MKKTIGKFEVEDKAYGIDVYLNGAGIGRIDGVKSNDLSEDEIDELMFGELDEDECVDWFGLECEGKAARHDLLSEKIYNYGS